MTTQTLKIEDLSKSSLNARKTFNKEALRDMKASILAHGLLQNLVVVKKGSDYEVIAGARRLEAMKELLKEGALKRDYMVRCEVVTPERALEMSVAENTIRQEMHPADAFEAYAALIDKNNSTKDVAMRFGVPEKHVIQRLKLGMVHPDLLKLFREDKMDIDSIMAFTLTDDQKKQIAVYKSLKSWERDSDHSIRSALMSKSVSSDDSLTKFVGVAAYEKAGGKVIKDLFSENVYFQDSVLLNKLATEKLNTEVEKLKKEGFAWVEASLKKDHEFAWGCEEAPYKTKEQRAKCGCYVSIDYSGKIDVERGLTKGKAKSAAKGSTTSTEKKKAKEGFSEALRTSLAEYRRQAIQVEFLAAGTLAADIVTFKAASSLYDEEHIYVYTGCDVNFTNHHTPQMMGETDASKSLSTAYKALNFSWAKAETEVERFQKFCALSGQEKSKLFIFAASKTLKPQMRDAKADDSYEAALTIMECDIRAHWRPTAENFFNRVRTDDLVAIGKEIFGKKWEAKTGGKAAIANQLHDAFANPTKTAAGDMEIKLKLETWLPEGMEVAETVQIKKRKAA